MIVMMCHPEVLEQVLTGLQAMGADVERTPAGLMIAGAIEIRTSPFLAKHPRRWEFPRERCVEYEASDEPWCRYFGIGREVEDTSRIVLWRMDTDCLLPRFLLFRFDTEFSPRVPWYAS